MAITYIGADTASTGSTGSGLTFDVSGVGIADGDLLVANLAIDGSGRSYTALDAGWTELRAAFNSAGSGMQAFYRIAASGDPTTYKFDPSTDTFLGGAILVFRGVDQTTPIDVASVSTTYAAGTSFVVPGITTVTDGAWLLIGASVDANSSTNLGPDAAMTERYEAAGRDNHLATQEIATAGATGSRTVTSASSLVACAWIAAIRPAGAGGHTAYTQAVSGSLTSSGAAVKRTARNLAGTVTSSGALTLVRAIMLLLGGTLSSSGAVAKSLARSLSGTLTSSGLVAVQRVILKALAGTLTSSGSVAKRIGLSLAGVIASAGGIRRAIAKGLSGALSWAGAVTSGEPPLTPTPDIASVYVDTGGLSARVDGGCLEVVADGGGLTLEVYG